MDDGDTSAGVPLLRELHCPVARTWRDLARRTTLAAMPLQRLTGAPDGAAAGEAQNGREHRALRGPSRPLVYQISVWVLPARQATAFDLAGATDSAAEDAPRGDSTRAPRRVVADGPRGVFCLGARPSAAHRGEGRRRGDGDDDDDELRLLRDARLSCRGQLGEESGAGCVADGSSDTAWRDGPPSIPRHGAGAWICATLRAPATVTRYAVQVPSDGDGSEDPTAWVLEGSHSRAAAFATAGARHGEGCAGGGGERDSTDGADDHAGALDDSWVQLDARHGVSFTERGQTLYFGCVSAVCGPYRRYRLRVTAVKGSQSGGCSGVAISAWRLWGAPVPEDGLPIWGGLRVELSGPANQVVLRTLDGRVRVESGVGAPYGQWSRLNVRLSEAGAALAVSSVDRPASIVEWEADGGEETRWWQRLVQQAAPICVACSDTDRTGRQLAPCFSGRLAAMCVSASAAALGAAGGGSTAVPDAVAADGYSPSVTSKVAPLASVADLLQWDARSCDPLGLEVAVEPLRKRWRGAGGTTGRPRVLVCHDCGTAVYREDADVQGLRGSHAYRMMAWHLCDVFVYFSHSRVTIPPVAWVNAAHRSGVQVLGTFVVEWAEGEADLLAFIDDAAVADALVALARRNGFDGWLINAESTLRGGAPAASRLAARVEYLRDAMHAAVPGSLVVWYDSVTVGGELLWQSALNDNNNAFFAASDAIFLDYHWKEDQLAASAAAAGRRALDVFVGVDVFGRGTHGGGGWRSHVAVAAAVEAGLSVAVFAPAWTYESQGGSSSAVSFMRMEDRFWRGGGWSHNLLAPDACEPRAAVEVLATDEGGDGWQRCSGDDRVDGGPADQAGFIASYEWCRRATTVQLPAALRGARWPAMEVEDWFVGVGPDYADSYRLRVELRDAEGTALAAFDSGVLTVSRAWQRVAARFDAPPPHTASVWIEQSGKDAERWAGHFGTRVAGLSLTVECVPHESAGGVGGLSPEGVASVIAPRSAAAQLPFESSFDTGSGTAMFIGGRCVGRGRWSHIGRQQPLPTFLGRAAVVDDDDIAASTLRTALVEDKGAFDGGTSLEVAGTIEAGGCGLHWPSVRLFVLDIAVPASRYLHVTTVHRAVGDGEAFTVVPELVLSDGQVLRGCDGTSERDLKSESGWCHQRFTMHAPLDGVVSELRLAVVATSDTLAPRFTLDAARRVHLLVGKVSVAVAEDMTAAGEPVAAAMEGSSAAAVTALRVTTMWSERSTDDPAAHDALLSWACSGFGDVVTRFEVWCEEQFLGDAFACAFVVDAGTVADLCAQHGCSKAGDLPFVVAAAV